MIHEGKLDYDTVGTRRLLTEIVESLEKDDVYEENGIFEAIVLINGYVVVLGP